MSYYDPPIVRHLKGVLGMALALMLMIVCLVAFAGFIVSIIAIFKVSAWAIVPAAICFFTAAGILYLAVKDF